MVKWGVGIAVVLALLSYWELALIAVICIPIAMVAIPTMIITAGATIGVLLAKGLLILLLILIFG
ncbi:hypothetical protein AB4152_13255 [Vibrio breoganii]|uniref:Uncharacterized protein n=1 Tax=Vibrio breoganii TaxID=553239 RepID=A0ABX1UBL7_9VIBR|nr:hypothetical protein [Vibrio breoganii]NMO73487.1 hypothetical protein [Vibrio breoganii]NMR70110.1 hypothetical protein [Vibrio breoganii]PMG08512.1 hypothetical protein BCV00_05600 [Vibrio breoganii]PML28150.1 hypothetical protein BCT82_01715 [Vibrio breoganii]PML89205.1 hypothetical protein BCT67_08555 [Vibrio breoganii]